jgi:hypothetical protein
MFFRSKLDVLGSDLKFIVVDVNPIVMFCVFTEVFGRFYLKCKFSTFHWIVLIQLCTAVKYISIFTCVITPCLHIRWDMVPKLFM